MCDYLKKRSFRNYVENFMAFFDHLSTPVDKWRNSFTGLRDCSQTMYVGNILTFLDHLLPCVDIFYGTVKLGNKECFDKEEIGIKELFMDYQPFYTINLLLDKELLPI